MGQKTKGEYFLVGFEILSTKKKDKKRRVFNKASGGGQGPISNFMNPSENNRWDKR